MPLALMYGRSMPAFQPLLVGHPAPLPLRKSWVQLEGPFELKAQSSHQAPLGPGGQAVQDSPYGIDQDS